VPKPFFYLLNS